MKKRIFIYTCIFLLCASMAYAAAPFYFFVEFDPNNLPTLDPNGVLDLMHSDPNGNLWYENKTGKRFKLSVFDPNLLLVSPLTIKYSSSYPFIKLIDSNTIGTEFLRIQSNKTTGFSIGCLAGDAITTGVCNTLGGTYSGGEMSSASNCSGWGYRTLMNTTASGNSAFGSECLRDNTTGTYNSGFGVYALGDNETGNYNIGIGYEAGKYHADGTYLISPENSIYIGSGTKGKDNDDENSIVIGFNAVGVGKNSCVLGNPNITTTVLRSGTVVGSTTSFKDFRVAHDANQACIAMDTYDTSTDSSLLIMRKARGVEAGRGIVSAGDNIMEILGGAWTGTGWGYSAGITAVVDTGPVTASTMPTRIEFYTSPNTSTSRALRMMVDSQGRVAVGGDTTIEEQFHIKSSTSTIPTLQLKAAASQSVDTFKIVNSSDSLLFTIDQSGNSWQHDANVVGNLYSGAMTYATDSGAVTAIDMGVSSDPNDGTEESLAFAVDGVVQAKFYTESNGAGTVDTPHVVMPGAFNFGADAGANDDYAITLKQTPSAYVTGMLLMFSANTANTGACTLNVNSLGAKALKSLHDQDPQDNYIEAGSVIMVVYDGTNFQILSPDANP